MEICQKRKLMKKRIIAAVAIPFLFTVFLLLVRSPIPAQGVLDKDSVFLAASKLPLIAVPFMVATGLLFTIMSFILAFLNYENYRKGNPGNESLEESLSYVVVGLLTASPLALQHYLMV